MFMYHVCYCLAVAMAGSKAHKVETIHPYVLSVVAIEECVGNVNLVHLLYRLIYKKFLEQLADTQIRSYNTTWCIHISIIFNFFFICLDRNLK